MLDREQLRAAYAATLVKRQMHRPTFDSLFDLYYPAGDAGGWRRCRSRGSSPSRPARRRRRGEVDDPARFAIRDGLRDYLLSGDDQQAQQLAREAMAGFGAVPGTGRGGSRPARRGRR